MPRQPGDNIILLQQRITEHPEDVDAWLELGHIYYKQEKWLEAIQVYRHITPLSPDSIAAYYNLGLAYMRTEQFREAIDAFQHMITLNPDISDAADAYYQLGECYFDLAKYDLAIEAFLQSTVLAPDDFVNFERLGQTCEYISRDEEAIATYRKVIELEPSYGMLIIRLGQLLKKHQRYEEVIALYRQATESDDEFFLQLGGLYQRLLRYADAAAMFIEAVHECEPPTDVYDMLISSESTHRFEEALQTVLLMQEHPETIAHTSYALGFIYRELGRYEDSIQAFRCYFESQLRYHTFIRVEIGIDYYFLQQYEEAIAEILQGMSGNANDAHGCYYLSLSYWKSGKPEQARKYYRQLESLDRELAKRLYRETGGFNGHT